MPGRIEQSRLHPVGAQWTLELYGAAVFHLRRRLVRTFSEKQTAYTLGKYKEFDRCKASMASAYMAVMQQVKQDGSTSRALGCFIADNCVRRSWRGSTAVLKEALAKRLAYSPTALADECYRQSFELQDYDKVVAYVTRPIEFMIARFDQKYAHRPPPPPSLSLSSPSRRRRGSARRKKCCGWSPHGVDRAISALPPLSPQVCGRPAAGVRGGGRACAAAA